MINTGCHKSPVSWPDELLVHMGKNTGDYKKHNRRTNHKSISKISQASCNSMRAENFPVNSSVRVLGAKSCTMTRLLKWLGSCYQELD